MKKEIKHYYCDCCGREIYDDDDIKEVRVPVTGIDHHEVKYIYASHLDLCEECYAALYEIISKYFAYMEVRPFSFNVKSEKRWE